MWRPGGGRSELTPRRLLTLVHQLPLDSRFYTILSGDTANQRWSAETHLLALIADLLQVGNQLAKTNVTRKRPDKIKPVPRPDNGEQRDDDLARQILFGEVEVDIVGEDTDHETGKLILPGREEA